MGLIGTCLELFDETKRDKLAYELGLMSDRFDDLLLPVAEELKEEGAIDPIGAASAKLEADLLAQYAADGSRKSRRYAKCIVESFHFGRKRLIELGLGEAAVGINYKLLPDEEQALREMIEAPFKADPRSSQAFASRVSLLNEIEVQLLAEAVVVSELGFKFAIRNAIFEAKMAAIDGKF